MVIAINEYSDEPIYLQIRNQIVLGISDGRLLPGEQLPTVRGLAQEIGINMSAEDIENLIEGLVNEIKKG